ncbi:hypothetical protein SAMN02927900_00383 [Rhizobium mongolense subsp. loessense]|uniref:Uncharacterized protein n=1 Tax=Rhizobium mongolense subsp. loessense TaxID=158890 RepID=A0A1G4PD22_9HYPH|nr:hypothetical protein SAMN02927900_00383 [Rhizobium mongolense subsp. loessense]
MDVFIVVLPWAYCLVAVLFLTMTLLEGWANHDRWTLARLAGAVACILWPLTLVVLLVHMLVLPLLSAGPDRSASDHSSKPLPKLLEGACRLP